MGEVLSDSNYCKLTNNFTLGPLDINNPFGTRAELKINFSNALITYFNKTTPQNRYNGGAALQNLNVITSNIIIPLDQTLDINCNVTYTLSNLLPDVTYIFNVKVNTTGNATYGLVSSNSIPFKTLLPPFPPRLTTVSQCNSGLLYERQGLDISSPSNILNIYSYAELNNTGGLYNIINNGGGLAILTDKNPAFTNILDQAKIIVTSGLIDTNIFSFQLWAPTLLSGPATQPSASDFSIINIGSQQQDPYAGNQRLSNFYLQASNVSVIITPTFLQAGNQPYSYSITHCNAGYSNITETFSNIYVDNLTQLASVEALTNYGYLNNTFISGLGCLATDQIYYLNLNLRYFVSYFLPACNILIRGQLSYTSLNNITYNSTPIILYSNTTIYDIDNNLITIGPAPVEVRLKLENIDLSGNGDIFFTTTHASQITANLTIENLVGTTNYETQLPYYFDTLSLNNLSINHSNSYAIGGQRYRSYGADYISDALFEVYNDYETIVDNLNLLDYNSELPLVGGFYANGKYIQDCNYFNDFDKFYDYLDIPFPIQYVQIKTEDTIRYATFKYSLYNSSNIEIKALEFNMNSAALFADILDSDSTFNTTQVPILHYKVDNVANDPDSLINTGWLNGNSFLPNDEPLTETNAKDGNPGLLPSTDNYIIDGIKRYWNIIPIPANTSYDVYIKIGLDNQTSLYFDYMYLISKYITVSGIFEPPTNGQFTVINPPTDVRISWENISQDVYETTEITGNFNETDYPTYPRRVVNPGDSKYIDDPINATSDSNEYDTTLLNADTYYNITLINKGVNGESSDPLLVTGKTDLPPYTYCNFYDGNMKFKFYKTDDDSEDIYFTNCNAYFIRSGTRTLVTNIISKESLTIKLVMSSTETHEPFIINYSNSSKTVDYPGPGLSEFTISANINTNIANFTFDSTYFLLPYIRNLEFTRNENNIELLFQNSGDMAIDTDGTIENTAYTGFFYKAALTVKSLDTLKDGSNNITLYNNYDCNYSQNFFVDSGTIAPTVNKMFVDSNGLIHPNYYTYVSGVLVFRTVTACNYNFWMQTSNLNSNFIMPTPITFALQSNSVNISNLTVNGATIPVYSAPNTGSELTNSLINANNNTFFSWSNVSLNRLSNIGPANTLSLVGIASNLSGGSAVVTQQLATQSGALLYFDNESLRTIARTNDSNFYYSRGTSGNILSGLNIYPNAGQQVLSGNNSNPIFGVSDNQFGNIYLHLNTIRTGTYSNELQIVNGYFTGLNQYSYQDYSMYYSPLNPNPNYTDIANIRWATFRWFIPSDSFTNRTTTARILFNNHNFTSSPSNITQTEIFWSFNNIYFFHKVVGINNNTTSGWVDGNRYFDGTLPTRRNLQNDGYQAGSLPSTSNNSRTIIVGDNITSGAGIGQKPYNLYIRIGFPARCNFYFDSIKLERINQR
jgi:hypothetical protein